MSLITVDNYLEKNFPNAESSIYRDLSLNFKKILEDSSSLDPAERYMNLMAIAVTLENKEMYTLAQSQLVALNTPAPVIQECSEVAGIMGMNNVYYKFRSYLPNEVKENYSRAGLRMQSLAKPISGKQNFEMMAMSVSIVNGCPMCIASHEKALIDLGLTADKVHELARLAAICKGLSSFATARSFLNV